VWDALVELESMMNRDGVTTVPLAIRDLERRRAEWESRRVDFVLLDEAQDLTPIRLRLFKSLSKRGLVVAADEGQILYLNESPFVRAGIDIAGGKTRVLKANFRNTVSIETLASKFYGGRFIAGAFREGPPPEWHFADHREDLMDRMVAKLNILTQEFGYVPENILIVHSGKKSGLEARLLSEGVRFRSVMEKDFQFKEAGALRLATFQSAKGLDAPVVFVFWNQVFTPEEWSTESVERLHRNFLYVAMTRAMEHLSLFVRRDESNSTQKLCEIGGDSQYP